MRTRRTGVQAGGHTDGARPPSRGQLWGVMPWIVRTKEGSLEFHDFSQLEWAFNNGLIAPDDEILDPGKDEWRKAAAHPHLRKSRPQRTARATYLGGVAISLVFALVALVMLALGYWLVALLIGLGLSFYMLRLNRHVMRPKVVRA